MKGSARLRWWLVPVPAMLLALAYFTMTRLPVTDQIDQVGKQLAIEETWVRQALDLAGPDPDAQLLAAEKRQQELAATKKEQTAHWSKADTRAQTVKEVSKLLGQCDVEVERSQAETQEEADNRVAMAARELSSRMQAQGGSAPSLWRLNLRCTFAQLLQSFERLQTLPAFALPVGIQVTPVDNPRRGPTDPRDFAVALWLWI